MQELNRSAVVGYPRHDKTEKSNRTLLLVVLLAFACD
jgi:hypothetical protein